jgi:predicted RNA-binding Zn-ribbon protein involved in translation (DUF1610 family)
MGMLDFITFDCPNCGTEIKAQSKSGECMCDVYHYDNVPADVAEDANRHAPYECESCGRKYSFGNLPSERRISLTIIEEDSLTPQGK